MVDIYSLAIEVTRRCNMQCAHCLRGCAQTKDIPDEVIDKALIDVKSIGNITFTGGEPTLNVHAIKHTLEVCKEKGIFVNGFYIVTNGRKVTSEFLRTCIDWYVYCVQCGGETDLCGIALSKDNFHGRIPLVNETLLRSLSFFRDDKFTDFTRGGLLDIGRAKQLSGYEKRTRYPHDIKSDVEVIDDVVYDNDQLLVTVNGNVIPVCDYAYEEEDELSIGNVDAGMEALLMPYVNAQC